MTPRRPVRAYKIRAIRAHLEELERVRRKLGYTKIRPEKVPRLRARVRYQIERLRWYLPKVDGVAHPCDPRTWEVVESSPAQKREAIELWRSFAPWRPPGRG